MGKLSLDLAEESRLELTKEQQKQIQEMYQEIAKEIGKKAESLPNTTSGALRRQYLKQLQSQINEQLTKLGKNLEETVKDNMFQVSLAAVKDNIKWLESVGMPLSGLFSHVPADVVNSVITGQVYSGNWSLSKAIWNSTEKAKQDINRIIASGIAQNKGSYEIAKDLEKYVNPKAQKEWDWSKVYPGTNKKVDYNAQRLARTLVSHAYQQSFIRTTRKNPFVTKYKWLTSNSHRVCPLCASREGRLYDKDELPIDHPMGMCTHVALIEDSMEDVANRLVDWVSGKNDPELEAWAKDLYGDAWNSISPPKVEYRYHATRRSSIPGIVEKGLLPNRGMYGKGVYFASTAEEAVEWTTETSTGGKTVLRVALDFLNSKGYEELSAEEDVYKMAQGWVTGKVPFDKIEIKVGEDEWWSLSNFATQYKNTVYNKLSDAAKKRVDRQVDKEVEEWIKKHTEKQ